MTVQAIIPQGTAFWHPPFNLPYLVSTAQVLQHQIDAVLHREFLLQENASSIL